jgi:hypothetical protein
VCKFDAATVVVPHAPFEQAGVDAIEIVASESNHKWLKSHGVIPVAYGDGVADRIRAAATPAARSSAGLGAAWQ